MSRFKELRLEKGVTQGRLAKALGTSQQTISRIEAKNETVPTDLLINASKYFNVSVDYILGLTDERFNQISEERVGEYLKKFGNIMNEYAALKPEYQEAVKSVVKTFIAAQDMESET